MASDPWNGLPENPERDGWHWLRSRIGGNVRVDQWLKEGLWMHCSINSTVRLSYEYLGPCLTPADLAARVEAERVACAKAVSVVFDRYHKKSDPISQTMAAGVVMAESSIRALGPTPAYDAAIKAAREDGMGAALLAVSQLTQPENGETGDLRFMRDAWNGVVEEAKAAIRAAKDQPA